jgi:hypothetical protein
MAHSLLAAKLDQVAPLTEWAACGTVTRTFSSFAAGHASARRRPSGGPGRGLGAHSWGKWASSAIALPFTMGHWLRPPPAAPGHVAQHRRAPAQSGPAPSRPPIYLKPSEEGT